VLDIQAINISVAFFLGSMGFHLMKWMFDSYGLAHVDFLLLLQARMHGF
jgi:hypothetical protein